MIGSGLHTLLRPRPRLHILRARWVELLPAFHLVLSKKTVMLVSPYFSLKPSRPLRITLIGNRPRQQLHVPTAQRVRRLHPGLVHMVLMCFLILLLQLPLQMHPIEHILPVRYRIEVPKDLLPQLRLSMQRVAVFNLSFFVILQSLRLQISSFTSSGGLLHQEVLKSSYKLIIHCCTLVMIMGRGEHLRFFGF